MNFFIICRDVAQVNTEVGKDVDEAAVVKERTNPIRSYVLFDIPEEHTNIGGCKPRSIGRAC